MRANISKRWRKSFKFILIGCGRVGHSYATVINSHPKMKLTAVIDVNKEAARAFGDSYRCKSHTSLDDYLAGNEYADCGIICTPPSEHEEIACSLMQKHINILCEQPLALNIDSAERMINVSRTYGVALMMGSLFRFVPDLIHAKCLIQAGILGHVLEFEADFRHPADMRNRWNIKPELSGGGVLIDSGSAAVDIARYFFGPVLGVRAEEGYRVQSKDVEDTVLLTMRTTSGVLGTIHLSWNLRNPGNEYLRIYGTHGNLCIGWNKSVYRPSGAKDWISFGEGFSSQKALTLQLMHFMNVIAGEDSQEVNAEDELESVRTIQVAYQSLQTGRFLNILSDQPAAVLSSKEHRFVVVHSEASLPA